MTQRLWLGCALASVLACNGDDEGNAMVDEGESSHGEDTSDVTGAASIPESEIDIHTWWQSASESAALDALTSVFSDGFQDVLIRVTTFDGQSDAAVVDLMDRTRAGNPADVFLVLPRDIDKWLTFSDDSGEGSLVPLDELMQQTGASEQIPPEVLDLVRRDGVTYAAPLGLHRHNGMFVNRSLIADLGLEAPRSLDEFANFCEDIAQHNQGLAESDQVFAIANTAQGWAIELTFKSVMVAAANALEPGSGGQYLIDFFDGKRSVEDPEYRAAAEFMNTVFRCSNQPPTVYSYTCRGGADDGDYCLTDTDCDEACVVMACVGGDLEGTPCETNDECGGGEATCAYNYHHEWDFNWDDAAALVRSERAVTFIHGDWAKGEYDAAGFFDFEVVPAFGTDGVFIYNLDNLATFSSAHHPVNATGFMQVAMSAEGQAAFASRKGSTPPRRDAPTDGFDDVAQATFAQYQDATHLQDTETNPSWDPVKNALRDLWRARYRDAFADEGEQFEADIAAFLSVSADAYASVIANDI